MASGDRARRITVLLSPRAVRRIRVTQNPWYETPEEVAAGLAWGREKARLLRWVRKRMGERLTLRERRCIELYFFQGMTYREAAVKTGVNASSVHRAVQRGLRKLRAAAARRPAKPAKREEAD
jgi:RNA polymerase sigma factor (sigma-70 family)